MYMPHVPPWRNGLAYLFWRWLCKKDGSFTSQLDAYFFGPSRGMNDYDSLAATYKGSNVKPDKQYSILPTVLKLAGDCRDKGIIDIGCGAGFFSLPLAKLGAFRVCGVDNSQAQIDLAMKLSPHPQISYRVGDAFVQHGGPVDIITAPFVVNYARTLPILRHFFGLNHRTLKKGGKIVYVVDLPNSKSLKRFGAVKTLLHPTDEATIRIDLFNEEKKICELNAVYYTPLTIERSLQEAGFRNVTWHKPIVSEEGMQAMGADFWKGYTDDPELGYITAEK